MPGYGEDGTGTYREVNIANGEVSVTSRECCSSCGIAP